MTRKGSGDHLNRAEAQGGEVRVEKGSGGRTAAATASDPHSNSPP